MTYSSLFAQVLVPSLILSGCGCLSSCDAFQKLEKGEQSKTIQNPKPSKLKVTTQNGFIRVSKGKGPNIDIHAVIKARSKERLEAVRIHAAKGQDGSFEIYAIFPEKRLSNESCSFTVTLPQTRGLVLKTSNGSITINQLQGPANLQSSNGALKIFDHHGPLLLSTSNGSVQVRDADESVEAKTSNGRIDVVLREDNPGPVQLKTSNGSIHLKVGKGFQGSLHARTSNGSLQADLPDEIRVDRKSRREMDIHFSDKGQESRLRTSNGSIQVEMR